MISEFAYVSPNAIIGSNVTIKVGAVIYDNVHIGDNCYIGEYSTIGTPAEYRKKDKQDGKVWIDKGTTIREYVSVQSPARGRDTIIGENCYIMRGCHIAHDCHLGEGVSLAPGVTLGGTTTLGDKVNMGLQACTHPNINIGDVAMIGLNSTITKDVEKHRKVVGLNKDIGLNTRGLELHHTCEFIIKEVEPSFFAEVCECGQVK